MDTEVDDSQLIRLLRDTERAQSARDPDRAAQLLLDAQRLSPDHPRVLNAAGRQMLMFGSAEGAVELFRRALDRERDNVSIWINLASALRRIGKFDEEEKALDEALRRQPRNLLALLQKAALFDLTGRPRTAARTYLAALQTIPAGAQLPEFLRPAIEQAARVVRESDTALGTHLGQRLGALRERYRLSDTSRFEHSLDAFLGRRRIYHSEPTFLQVPRLPPIEFYERDRFGWLEELEASTDAIRAEFEAVMNQQSGELTPYIQYSDASPLDQWRELNHSRRWSAYFLWRDGVRVTEHLQACAATCAALERIPLFDVPGFAPTAFFSILDAGTRIPPHVGVTNMRLIVHLPLIVPPKCGFRVGAESREWVPGQAWVFDDTIEHEAWNDSDRPRAVLIFDIWNPALSAAERDLYGTLVTSIKEFYGDEFAAATT